MVSRKNVKKWPVMELVQMPNSITSRWWNWSFEPIPSQAIFSGDHFYSRFFHMFACLRWLRVGPKMAQDGSMLAPRWPKIGLCWLKLALKRPKWPPKASKVLQLKPEMASGWLPNPCYRGLKLSICQIPNGVPEATGADHGNSLGSNAPNPKRIKHIPVQTSKVNN